MLFINILYYFRALIFQNYHNLTSYSLCTINLIILADFLQPDYLTRNTYILGASIWTNRVDEGNSVNVKGLCDILCFLWLGCRNRKYSLDRYKLAATFSGGKHKRLYIATFSRLRNDNVSLLLVNPKLFFHYEYKCSANSVKQTMLSRSA